jgi:hypothetical protein
MKESLAILFVLISIQSHAIITNPCDQDYFTSSEMGEFYYHERMEILNTDGDLVGNLILGNEEVDGLFLCGSSNITSNQHFFGLSRRISYEDIIKDGGALDSVKPYSSLNDTHSIEFYKSKTVSSTVKSYMIETTMKMRSLKTGHFVAIEKVQIRLRKLDYLYD